MNLEINTICVIGPIVRELIDVDGVYMPKSSNMFYFTSSLHENCQTCHISYSESFIGVEKLHVKKILKTISSHTGQAQLLMDVRQSDYKRIFKYLKDFTKKINVKRYISTNGSEMMLCVVKLDLYKLK